MQGAVNRLRDFFDGLASIQDTNIKINEMVAARTLDPAFVAVLSKAYASVQESPYTDTEIADVLAHLYHITQEKLINNIPYEIRILKHLLALDDPLLIESELENAVSSCSAFDSKPDDYVLTTPDLLLLNVEVIIRTHEKNRARALYQNQSVEALKPLVMKTATELRTILISKHM